MPNQPLLFQTETSDMLPGLSDPSSNPGATKRSLTRRQLHEVKQKALLAAQKLRNSDDAYERIVQEINEAVRTRSSYLLAQEPEGEPVPPEVAWENEDMSFIAAVLGRLMYQDGSTRAELDHLLEINDLKLAKTQADILDEFDVFGPENSIQSLSRLGIKMPVTHEKLVELFGQPIQRYAEIVKRPFRAGRAVVAGCLVRSPKITLTRREPKRQMAFLELAALDEDDTISVFIHPLGYHLTAKFDPALSSDDIIIIVGEKEQNVESGAVSIIVNNSGQIYRFNLDTQALV